MYYQVSSFETQADISTRLSVFDSPEGLSNTFKTHTNISLYFKRRYLNYKYWNACCFQGVITESLFFSGTYHICCLKNLLC